MALRQSSFTARERTKPLVPELFAELSVSRQSVFLHSKPRAQDACKFCPNLDIPQYRDHLSEEKQTELDKRAHSLSRRAFENKLFKVSEFCWEADAWRYVFGVINDDDRLRIDKRPYEFVEVDEQGEKSIKRRIPDATMGLRSYDDFDMVHGFPCHVRDCDEDHTSMQPHRALHQDRLVAQMLNQECGLIVDGIWGRTDILFPFAVYEAKKRAASYESAQEQVYHACMAYLAMLDDLVRDPANPTQYQSKDSGNYQLFAFISCGIHWEVYVAWPFLGCCHVETIWEGNVDEFSRAYDLICIVDQIHDYASTQHREFVIKHLEPWLSRAEAFENTQCDILNTRHDEIFIEPIERAPQWHLMKAASQRALNAKANLTRKRKKETKGTDSEAASDRVDYP